MQMNLRNKWIFVIMLFFVAASARAGEDSKFSKLRTEMVRTQIEARGIRDNRVLEAMRKVPRHEFVPALQRRFAYSDTPLPIGEGQTISQPYIVALMSELLSLSGKERVLEVGTGSGYQAAILAELAAYVYTIEILPILAERANKLLSELGYKNVLVKCADGYLGWQEYAPFDAIIVTCAPQEIPQALVEQLAEGGRMVIPVGSINQELMLIKKKNGEVKMEDVIPVRFVPMVHSE
jgi:protein-L-isoaspartate(D-aspartate) O-methyltransferase